jgi:hypothetical protein
MYLARVQDQLTVNLPKAGTWSCAMVEETGSSKQFAHRGSLFGTCILRAPLAINGACRLGNPEDRH